MAHSKMTKKGKSHYVESWNPKAKKFINTCALCGKQGYKPSIDESGFVNVSDTVKNYEHSAIRSELTAILKPLPLNEYNLCEVCEKLTFKKEN